ACGTGEPSDSAKLSCPHGTIGNHRGFRLNNDDQQALRESFGLSYVLGTPTATDRRKRNGDTAQIDQDRWSLEVDTAPVEWQRRQWTR
ncbi:hypothetical protein, partial [Jatrophihabitans lederbergiae]